MNIQIFFLTICVEVPILFFVTRSSDLTFRRVPDSLDAPTLIRGLLSANSVNPG